MQGYLVVAGFGFTGVANTVVTGATGAAVVTEPPGMLVSGGVGGAHADGSCSTRQAR